jgi:hypothetical protein
MRNESERFSMSKLVNAKWCIENINSGDTMSFGAVKAEVQELFASRSISEAKEEIGDVLYFSYCWLQSNLGINMPMMGAMGSVHKFVDRLDVWKDIFEDHGYDFSPKYLVGGSNYKKQHKVDAALALAHADQAVTCPRCHCEHTPVQGWYEIASIEKYGECDRCMARYDVECESSEDLIAQAFEYGTDRTYVTTCNTCSQVTVMHEDDHDNTESACTCPDKAVLCDGCNEKHVPADMSVVNEFIALCKHCNA